MELRVKAISLPLECKHQQGQPMIHTTEIRVDVLTSPEGQLCGDINYYPDKRHDDAYFITDSLIPASCLFWTIKITLNECLQCKVVKGF